MALPKYVNDSYDTPKSEPRGEGMKWNKIDSYDSYKPFNQEQKKDFYDMMSPIWSNQMAKQYNKDMKEDMLRSVTEEVKLWDMNDSLDETKDHINPSHYKNVAYGYQYAELMIPMLERFTGVQAHLMGQVYKYLMRSGLKDSLEQDLTKAKWYLDAMLEHVKTNKITVNK